MYTNEIHSNLIVGLAFFDEGALSIIYVFRCVFGWDVHRNYLKGRHSYTKTGLDYGDLVLSDMRRNQSKVWRAQGVHQLCITLGRFSHRTIHN